MPRAAARAPRSRARLRWHCLPRGRADTRDRARAPRCAGRVPRLRCAAAARAARAAPAGAPPRRSARRSCARARSPWRALALERGSRGVCFGKCVLERCRLTLEILDLRERLDRGLGVAVRGRDVADLLELDLELADPSLASLELEAQRFDLARNVGDSGR